MGNTLRANGTYEQAGRNAGDEEQGIGEVHNEAHENDNDESSSEESEDEEEQTNRAPSEDRGSRSPFNFALNSLMPPASDLHEWSTQRLVAHPPKVHHTRTVKCDVNLSRETLRLIPVGEASPSATSEGDQEEGSTDEKNSSSSPPTKYQVQFNFDANVECRVKVYFVAREKRDEDNHLVGYTSAYDFTCPPTLFPNVGLKQQYFQPLSHPFDVSLYTEKELAYDPDTQTFPVIIVLEPSGVTNDEQKERITSQTTFATLLKCTDGSYVIKPVKVKIEFRGVTYVVHDIFGLDKDAHGETGKECVVCMTEQRDTVVLPCRHMCLCRACAEVLRYQTTKCPICRSTFTSLLKIEAKESSDPDEEPLKKKKKSNGKKDKDKERVKGESSSSTSAVTVGH